MGINQKIIDITNYDNSCSSEVVISLNKIEFENPVLTFQKIRIKHERFLCKETIIKVTENQYQKFINYLNRTNELFLVDFGNIKHVKYLLSFSFGESRKVNSKIAQLILNTLTLNGSCDLFLQWEIALEFEKLTKKSNNYKVIPIELNAGQEYMTTVDVANKFKQLSKISSKDDVFIIGQSWHGLSILNTCRKLNIKIVGGKFVKDFAINDPQEWVRDAFSWVLKESTKTIK